jgi:iron complex outermembrane receptor protein
MPGCVLAVVASLAWSGTAQAQAQGRQATSVSDSPEAEAAADAGEIIVTAQKRAENIQDVPLSVQVLGSEQLAAAGVREFTDLTRVAPSLVIRPAEHPQNAAISLRGVGHLRLFDRRRAKRCDPGRRCALAFQARAFTDLPDIERIEVLRGAAVDSLRQGGVGRPDQHRHKGANQGIHGNDNAIGTTDEEYGVNFSIAGPVSERLGYRVSGS